MVTMIDGRRGSHGNERVRKRNVSLLAQFDCVDAPLSNRVRPLRSESETGAEAFAGQGVAVALPRCTMLTAASGRRSSAEMSMGISMRRGERRSPNSFSTARRCRSSNDKENTMDLEQIDLFVYFIL